MGYGCSVTRVAALAGVWVKLLLSQASAFGGDNVGAAAAARVMQVPAPKRLGLAKSRVREPDVSVRVSTKPAKLGLQGDEADGA